jgi:hypothetical protein
MMGDADLFGTYVLGRAIDRRSAQLYEQAERALGYGADDALVRLVRRHPRLLRPIDTLLAVLRPDALLRKKLLLMAAILETQPQYAADFLPRAQ